MQQSTGRVEPREGFWWRLLTAVRDICGTRKRSEDANRAPAFLIGPPPLPPRVPAAPPANTSNAVVLASTEQVGADPRGPIQDLHLPGESLVDLAKECSTAAGKAVKSAEAKAARLRKQLSDPAEAQSWRQRARALQKADPESWSPELKQLRLPVPVCGAGHADSEQKDNSMDARDGQPEEIDIVLPLSGESFEKNSEACVKRAEKLERANIRCSQLLADAQEELCKWRDAEIVATQGHCESSLLNLRKALVDAGYLRSAASLAASTTAAADAARKVEEAKLRRKYGKGVDCFLSPSGYEVVVGRDAGSNERVSFEITPDDAFWFHSDCGVPGSHVAILKPAAEVASMDDVEFAASIAAWHSKARAHTMAAVCYCYGGQLGRPVVPKLGRVHIRGGRGTLRVAPAPPPGDQDG